MKVDIEILLSLYALMCVVSNIVNLAIELCKVIFSQILIISCFANTFDGVSLSSQTTHLGQAFIY